MRRKRARSNARNLFYSQAKFGQITKITKLAPQKYVKKNYKIFKVKNIRRSL